MTKNQTLAMLKTADDYLSGQQISSQLGVSRAAVNAAIQSLRREGYDILSATNRGYKLNNAPDKLSKGELLPLLGAKRLQSLFYLDSVDSTNNYLRALAQQGAPEGTIVIANEQTAGKGRLGRSFISPGDQGIYLSLLLRPTVAPTATIGLTAKTAVAVSDAVLALYGLRPDIKWVNDLLLKGKKFCGILTEMAVEGESGHIQHLIIGVGVNVNQVQEDFPPQLRQSATSLGATVGRSVKRALLAAQIIKELDKLNAAAPQDDSYYLQQYKKDCLTLGKAVRIISPAGEKNGLAEDIDDNYALIVRLDNGERHVISSGEVSVRGLDGYV